MGKPVHTFSILLLLTAVVMPTTTRGRTPGAPILGQGEPIAAIRQALEDGRVADAVELAENARAAGPESAELMMWLGHAHRRAGNLAAATRSYLLAQRLQPDNPEILMGLGAVRESIGDQTGALQVYDRVIELSPANPAPYRRAAAAQMRRSNYAAAARYLNGARPLQPNNLEVLYLLGVAHYLNQDHDAAIEVLEAALLQDADYVPAIYTMGVVLADRPQQHDRALGLLRRAAVGGWEEVNATYVIGRILADRGDHEGAVQALSRSLELDPDQLEANYRIAQALARLGRRDEARSYSQHFSRLQQEFNAEEARTKKLKTLRNALVKALGESDLAEVNRLLGELLAADPENPETLLRAAKIWISAGDRVAATDAVVATLQLQPEHFEGLYLRAVLLADAQDLVSARRALELSLRSNPLFPDAYAVLGSVLAELGEFEAAVDSYLAAIDLDADNPAYYLNLAAIYRQLGRDQLETETITHYRRLIQPQGESRP